MASSIQTSTLNPSTHQSPALAILADSNVQDPRPATLKDLVECDFTLYRVTHMPSFLRFTAAPESLKYLVMACLSPLFADFTDIADTDTREMALGNLPPQSRLAGGDDDEDHTFLFPGETSQDMLRVVAGWMELDPCLHVMFVPPLLHQGSTFREDSSAYMVRVQGRLVWVYSYFCFT